MITYLLDRIRITLGNSKCPLYNKCSGADNENENCVSFRGRNEDNGKRAECYGFFKTKIRSEKQGLLSGLAGIVTENILSIGGGED